jgi:hypothetical protein
VSVDTKGLLRVDVWERGRAVRGVPQARRDEVRVLDTASRNDWPGGKAFWKFQKTSFFGVAWNQTLN